MFPSGQESDTDLRFPPGIEKNITESSKVNDQHGCDEGDDLDGLSYRPTAITIGEATNDRSKPLEKASENVNDQFSAEILQTVGESDCTSLAQNLNDNSETDADPVQRESKESNW